jgi:hypothetical protein
MHKVRLVAVFVEDKLGTLALTTIVLAEAGVNIRWVGIASGERFGVIRFLVDKVETAQKALADHGFAVSLNEVLALEVEDRPGGLAHVAEVLARHGVNVVNASGFVVASGKRAVMIIEAADMDKAHAALRGQHVHLISEEELIKL